MELRTSLVPYGERRTNYLKVFGWAVNLRTEPDAHRHHLSPDVLESAVYDYMAKSGSAARSHGKTSIDPKAKLHVGRVVESFAATEEKHKHMGYPTGLNLGWWGGWEFTDPETIEAILSGELGELSYGGSGIPVERPDGDFDITDLDLDEVSVVKNGAGHEVNVRLLKSADLEREKQMAFSQARKQRILKFLEGKPGCEPIAKSFEAKPELMSLLAQVPEELRAQLMELLNQMMAEDPAPAAPTPAPAAPTPAPTTAPPPSSPPPPPHPEDVGKTEDPEDIAKQRIDELEKQLAEMKKQNATQEARTEVAKSFDGAVAVSTTPALTAALTQVKMESPAAAEVIIKAFQDTDRMVQDQMKGARDPFSPIGDPHDPASFEAMSADDQLVAATAQELKKAKETGEEISGQQAQDRARLRLNG